MDSLPCYQSNQNTSKKYNSILIIIRCAHILFVNLIIACIAKTTLKSGSILFYYADCPRSHMLPEYEALSAKAKKLIK